MFYLSLCLSPKAGGFSVTAPLALVALFELTFKLLLICLIKSGIFTMMIVHFCFSFSSLYAIFFIVWKKITSPEVGAINFTSLLFLENKIHEAWWVGNFQNFLKGKKDVTCTQLRSQRATAGLLNLVIDATPPVCVIVVVVDVSVRPILRLEVVVVVLYTSVLGEPPTLSWLLRYY